MTVERFPVAVRAFTEDAGTRRTRRIPRLRTILAELLDENEAELRRLHSWLKENTSRDDLLAEMAGMPTLAPVGQWASRAVRGRYGNPAVSLSRELARLFRPNRRASALSKWGSLVLVLDTETTIDPTQRLLFGGWRLCRWSFDGRTLQCISEGLFYAGDLPERDPAGYATLQDYAAEREASTARPWPRNIWLVSTRQFVKNVLLKYGWEYAKKALIVGFNLPFDLSRLAVNVGPARRQNYYGGFSFTLLDYTDKETGERKESPFAPRLQIATHSSKRHLMRFSGSELGRNDIARDGRNFPGGRFLDCRTLAYALTNKSHSLKSACEIFDVEHGKQHVPDSGHGVITPEYIDYNRADVAATCGLLEKLRAEFDLLDPWEGKAHEFI